MVRKRLSREHTRSAAQQIRAFCKAPTKKDRFIHCQSIKSMPCHCSLDAETPKPHIQIEDALAASVPLTMLIQPSRYGSIQLELGIGLVLAARDRLLHVLWLPALVDKASV